MSKDYLIMIPGGVIGLIMVLSMVFTPIYNSKKYDKVVGVIIDDRLIISGRKNTQSYYIDFEYEYNGVEYSTSELLPEPSKKDKKPVGSELDVYVNPENPAEVSLLYGNKGKYILLVVMLIYNIGIMYRFIKEYKEINRYSGQFKNTFSK